ncbi:MAG: hypothetical protein Q8R96_11565 [Bacteroidota bacterium]|nr:hypothetical protein [Bacteroidota bacterium]
MIINFYTDNEQHAATVENYLFSESKITELMNGQKIETENGDRYQVNYQEFTDDTRKDLNAFLWKFQTPAEYTF